MTLVTTGAHHLARLGESTMERVGDHRSLLFEGTWHSSGALFERSRRVAGGLRALGVQPGDRVAQLVIAPVTIAELEEATSLTDTTRGAGGFGHTG